MQNSTNMRILELLRFLYERTDENHPATVSDIIAHLNGKGIQAVRQTVYADTNALIDAGIDIVVVKSTQNQYFMGNRLFEYPELKMLTDAVASSKIISAKKSEELVQKLCRLTSLHQAKQLQKFAALSSRVKPHNEKVYYIIDNIANINTRKTMIPAINQWFPFMPPLLSPLLSANPASHGTKFRSLQNFRNVLVENGWSFGGKLADGLHRYIVLAFYITASLYVFHR